MGGRKGPYRVARVAVWLLAVTALGAVPARGAQPPAPWPSRPDGIVFKWENARVPMQAFDAGGKPVPNAALGPTGLAWIGRGYAMQIQNGAFLAQNGAEHVLARLKRANRMTIETTLTTLFAAPYGVCNVADKPILTFGSGPDEQNFSLVQGPGVFRNNGMLSVYLRTSPPEGGAPTLSKVDIAYITTAGMKNTPPIGRGEAVHAVVTYEPGLLVGYVNGRKVIENRSMGGGFSAWSPLPLIFGGAEPIQRDERVRHWQGMIEGVCLYDRVLGAEEVLENYKRYRRRLDARALPERLEMQAKLTAKSNVMTPEEIAPYRNELAVYEYEVTKVASGQYKPARVRVAHWVVMDRIMRAQARLEPGAACALVLEPFDAHPELGPERLVSTLPVAADLDLYVDVGRIDERPADPALVKAQEEERRRRQEVKPKPRLDLTRVKENVLRVSDGRPVRIAWLRAVEPEGAPPPPDPACYTSTLLMGFDTGTGAERPLLSEPRPFKQPLITWDGSRIVFADAREQKACVMDWDGRNLREIARGRFHNVLTYHREEDTGIEWVYLNDIGSAEAPPGYSSASGSRVYRVQIDNPARRRFVWEGQVGPFQVSADGRCAGGGFPWPVQSVVDLDERTIDHRGTGCEGRLAPDNSLRFFYYDGQHTGIIVSDRDGANERKIHLIRLRPDFVSSVHSIAWTNDVRYFAMSVPILGGSGGRRHPQADLFLGRLDDGVTAVLDLAQVTDSSVLNTYACAWVRPKEATGAGGSRPVRPLPQIEPRPASAEARTAQETAEADWTNSTGMKFHRIPAGTFLMGGDGLRAAEPHKVTLTKPFHIGVFEVTQEQWAKVMGGNPSCRVGPLLPVENVCWLEVQEFLKRLSEKDGAAYRLPTDAEWEYACRAGSATYYYWMHVFDRRYAWAAENSEDRTHEVGTRLPNAWGLHDMAGNVFEWTSETFVEKRRDQPETDPRDPVDLKAQNRANILYRGGAYSSNADYCMSGTRVYVVNGQEYRSPAIGFRVVCDQIKTK